MRVEILDDQRAAAHADALAELLREAVENGALVSYVLPFALEAAFAYWRDILPSIAAGERLLLCAFEGEQLVGTVQLYLSPEPNAPHRGEVYKLLVRRDFQRKRIGEILMRAVESEARLRGRTLLLLDTVQDGAGESLYRRLGWREIGAVPNHFVDPFGNPQTSVYFMRALD